ncbi:MAG: hypothetical protein AAF390_13940 [Pseudomonadota bacterium]
MQLDRLVSRTVTRAMSQIARSGLAARRTAPAADGPAPAGRPAARGSGSWANEWAGARAAVERAKALASRGRARKGKADTPDDMIPEGTVRTRPLMGVREAKLYNWIVDRLEVEAPTCTLHTGVALSAFLVSDRARPGHDPLAGMVADFLVVDGQGQPAIALIRENTSDPARHLLMLDALLDADLPIVDVPQRISLSAFWSQIAANLPEE